MALSRSSSVIAIERLFFIAHFKKRSFQNIKMPIQNKTFKIGQKEGDQQIANMHAVDIGIGG